MKFVIEGPPRTKKNHQRIMRRANGRAFVMQSEQAIAWEESAVLQLAAQFRKQSASGCARADEMNLRALVYRERATGDLGNYLAPICDALERAGVVVNDRLIAGFDGSRLLIDRQRPRVEIELTVMGRS